MIPGNIRIEYQRRHAGTRAMWMIMLFANAMNVLLGAVSDPSLAAYCALCLAGLVMVGVINWSG